MVAHFNRIHSRMCIGVLLMAALIIGCSSSSSDDDDDGSGAPKACTRASECDATEYCRFPDLTCGILADQGVCQEIPPSCGSARNEVCGCDGETYDNACDAVSNEQSILAGAACEELTQSANQLCGGPGAIPCREGTFCNYFDGSCGRGETYGVCTPLRLQCDIAADPVCGCDGQTYTNTCFSQAAGVSIASDGSC